MLKTGLSTCGKTIDENLFCEYQKAGIEAMEISMADYLYDSIDYENIKKLSDKYNIELWSFHLPFSPFEKIDISSPDETIRGYTVNYFSQMIQKAAAIGIDKFVVHPSIEPLEDSERQIHMENAKKSLCELADIAASFNAVIAVEDLPRTCLGRNSSEIAELISCDERLRICFDTNHLLKEDYVEFINNVGSKIITTHVSDYDFEDERHWLPGEGDIDWHKMYNALINAGYRGVWLYELGFGAGRNIERSRDLTTEDFARNAAEIFEGKELTVIK